MLFAASHISAQSNIEEIAEQKTLLWGNWACSVAFDEPDLDLAMYTFSIFKPDGTYVNGLETRHSVFEISIVSEGRWNIEQKDVVTSSIDNIRYHRGKYSEELGEERFNEIKKSFLAESRNLLGELEEEKILLLNKTKMVVLYEDPDDEAYGTFTCKRVTREKVEERFGIVLTEKNS